MMMHNEEDEDAEGYLDPNDLAIIDDQTWEPTDEDILAYAMKIGFDVENDPDELFEVAYYFLKTPLPEGWKRAIYKETGEIMYINMEDGEIEITTEIEETAHAAYVKKKEEFIRKEELKKKEAETKIVPRTKIPPLNSNKNATSSTSTSQKLASLGTSKETSSQSQSNQTKSSNQGINTVNQANKVTTSSQVIQKSSIPIQEKERDKTPLSYLKSEKSQSDISFTDNSEKDYTQSDHKIKPVNRAKDLEKEKKDYFDIKLFELKEFEASLREKYTLDKAQYKYNKEKFRIKYENECQDKLDKEIDKINTQQKEKLSLYESQLKSTMTKESDKYRKDIQKETDDQKAVQQSKNTTEDFSNHPDILALNHQKEIIQEKISKIASIKEESKLKNSIVKDNFNNSKQLLQEKNRLDKNNILKQHQVDIKQIELNKENDYNKEAERLKQMNLQKSINLKQSSLNIGLVYNQELDPTKSKIFDDYQKAVESDYQINCKAIKQEYEITSSVEIQGYMSNIINEKEDKIKQYNKSLAELEKDYFSSLTNMREIAKRNTKESELEMTNKFDSMLNRFNDIQKGLYPQGNTLVSQIISAIREVIIQEIDVDVVEMKSEEIVRRYLDEQVIKCQKMKNAFDISESDYFYKSFIVKYLAEVISHMLKIILENPINDINNKQGELNREANDEIVISLMQFAKDKLDQYKFKYLQQKDKRLYPFLSKDMSNESIYQSPHISLGIMGNNDKQIMNLNRIQSLSKKQTGSDRYDQKDNILLSQSQLQSQSQIQLQVQAQEDFDQQQQSDNNDKNNKDPNNDINCYIINNSNINDISIPLLPDNTLCQLNNDELGLYSDITIFLKNEYIKLIELSSTHNIKLNMLIVDKIRLHTEECFNFIHKNISRTIHRNFFKEKLLVLITNMNDYKNNFNINQDDTYYLKRNQMNQLDQINQQIAIEDKMNVSTKSIGGNNSLYNNNNNRRKTENYSNSVNYGSGKNIIELNNKDDMTMNNEHIQSNMNVKVSNNYINSFNNFYTHYTSGQSLHRKITSPFTHEFFNFKKNNYEIQSKIDSLKYNQSSGNR